MESISKYNLHGIEYVKLTELNELIRDMKQKAMDGTEPGYMEPDKDKRMSAMLALNHLGAVLNKEKTEEKMHERLEEARVKAAAQDSTEKALQDAQEEKPGMYMVYKAGKTREDFRVFVEWNNGIPVIARTGGIIFTYESMAKHVAQHVAEKLGEGWKVVDVGNEECRKAEKLLAAMFREDEDEDWADGIGQAFSPD